MTHGPVTVIEVFPGLDNADNGIFTSYTYWGLYCWEVSYYSSVSEKYSTVLVEFNGTVTVIERDY